MYSNAESSSMERDLLTAVLIGLGIGAAGLLIMAVWWLRLAPGPEARGSLAGSAASALGSLMVAVATYALVTRTGKLTDATEEMAETSEAIRNLEERRDEVEVSIRGAVVSQQRVRAMLVNRGLKPTAVPEGEAVLEWEGKRIELCPQACQNPRDEARVPYIEPGGLMEFDLVGFENGIPDSWVGKTVNVKVSVGPALGDSVKNEFEVEIQEEPFDYLTMA